uniref:hypothetical protein n=1 Tax=Pandoraea pnomenusa TaxID=93220 RepID=UPI0003C74E9D|nr:hypothetical protein [Pandoraea pnomenusa]
MTQTFEQWAESEGLDMSVDWKGDLTSPVTAGALRGWEAAQSAGQEAVALTDEEILAIAVHHFKNGYDNSPKALSAFCDCVRSVITVYAPTVNGGERELGQVIDERDQYHDAADKLAGAIAKHFGVEIGEHSNLNCPWQNALDHIAQATKRAADAQQVDESPNIRRALEQALMALTGYLPAHRNAVTDAAIEAARAALMSPAKVGTVAQVTPEEQAEINAALDRDDEIACSSCGLTMAQSRDLAAAKAAGDEREAFKWPPMPAFPQALLGSKEGGYLFTEHQMQGYANAYGEIVRATLSADGGEDKRDAEYWRFLREQHEGTESFEDAEGFTVTEPTARAFTVFKPGQGDYHLEPVGCMPGELEETIRAAIAANQAKGDA